MKPESGNAAPSLHTREALYEHLDAYLAALAAKAPSRVPWADFVFNTENNVALQIGDGLWGTIERFGDYQLNFADVETGQVGCFGVAVEPLEESAFATRIKVNRDGRICEVETIVVRQADSGLKFENQKFHDKPVMNAVVEEGARVPRARMISLADGYFDTLQLNDGKLFTHFHPDCQRVENGVQTTNNSALASFIPVAGLGCEEQFRLGYYRYDDELRARRFPLVDEERGLVLAGGFIDHAGRLGDYKLTDGRALSSPIRRPHSFYLMELFKIEDGAIRQIEANFITVPYKMPSPWDRQ